VITPALRTVQLDLVKNVADIDRRIRVCGSGAISVVIPVRNAEVTIGRTLRSLLPDRSRIREILLVDDGSDDATVQMASETAERCCLPLQIVPIQAGSSGAARNVGVDRAVGDFIFFLDADDEVIAGSLGLLHVALHEEPAAGCAIGASIRRTEGRPDKLKIPSGYCEDTNENAKRYLSNRTWPIAVGSALVRTSAVAGIRFPTSVNLDEDTCYWAAVLARVPVVAIRDPVLLYIHDELRMSKRFTTSPRRTLLAISHELDKLATCGIDRDILQWRKAWIALRLTRQLIMVGHFEGANRMMRAVRAHPQFRRTWKSFQYSIRIRYGTVNRRLRLQRTRSKLCARAAPDGQLRTLVLAPDPAAPPVSGAELRNWQNAVAASRVGPVTFASVRPVLEAGGEFDSKVHVTALTAQGEPRGRSLGRRRTSVDIRIPQSALKRLVALVRDFQPDVVVVEGLPLFPLLKCLRPLSRLLILDMHNVESHLSGQMGNRPKHPVLLSRFFPDDAARILRLERKAIPLVDRIWVCSDQDEDRIRRLFRVPIPVDVVPNGIPRFEAPKELPPFRAVGAESPIILFVGHLSYRPNIDAAVRLATKILPLVQQRFPEPRLILAGRSPAPAVRSLENVSGVKILANPDDILSVIRQAHLTVVPLLSGGGTRLKILEAMAWGLPIVATSRAVEGLGLVDGRDVLIAETDDDFAKHIVTLCAEPERIEVQRQTAHDKVISLFGPAAIERAVCKGLGLDADQT